MIPHPTIKHSRVPMQDRSQGHLLCNSSQTNIQICNVQVAKLSLRISLSLFWSRCSSKIGYKSL